MTKQKIAFIGLALLLFLGRTLYGLTSEFWFEDELQIYLIGLKSFTTAAWPYWGPDVVYTHTQIPGALQGLLISCGFYIWAIPEMPTIVLNILSFVSLFFFALYISKRIPSLPFWVILCWLMTLTWTMDYGTRVVNPSYVLVFSIPFFISLFELLPIYKTRMVSRWLAFLLLGLSTTLLMQIHLSYVLLFPFIGLVIFFECKKKSMAMKEKLFSVTLFACGLALGLATLIPTWQLQSTHKSVISNIVFSLDNFKNIISILTRYLSFASFEIPYILGGTTAERLDLIKTYPWSLPAVLYLLVLGWVLVAIYLFVFFKNKEQGPWKHIKRLAIMGYVLVFLSFFFSVKGPSSHTFYILFPLVAFFSFYCHGWLWVTYKKWKSVMYIALISCVIFYTAFGLYNFKHKSMYMNRSKVSQALIAKNYKLLSTERSAGWRNE